MGNFRLDIEYDGTGFSGWQKQPGRRTVQGELERACRRVAGGSPQVTAAGRTDAGVHALGQVASVRLGWRPAAPALASALNANLPADIAVVRSRAAPAGFDARRSAKWRLYRYAMFVRPVRAPLLERRALRLSRAPSLAAMRAAASLFQGRKDFSAFCTKAAGERGPVRTVLRCSVAGKGGFIRVELAADAFLHRLVRMVAGALLAAGQGKLSRRAIREALKGRPPAPLAPPLPARGLALLAVGYGRDPLPPVWDPLLAW